MTSPFMQTEPRTVYVQQGQFNLAAGCALDAISSLTRIPANSRCGQSKRERANRAELRPGCRCTNGPRHQKKSASIPLVARSLSIKRRRSTIIMSTRFARHDIQQHCRDRRRSPRHAPRQVRTLYLFISLFPFVFVSKLTFGLALVPASIPPSTRSRYTLLSSTTEKSPSLRAHHVVLGARLRCSMRVRALRLPS